MIRLTRINHQNIVVNSDLIEHVESTPDTVLTLTTAQKILVLETVDEVVDRVVEFRRRILQGAFSLTETRPALES
ncbi:MAG TPA: flagellar FlbD family protein [Bryobacteraceae bacterium]|nr:flagellar FlbD family protein [Bryobacteraceae bacterium]